MGSCLAELALPCCIGAIGRYDIDIAAPSETRFHGEVSLHEICGGYTYFEEAYQNTLPEFTAWAFYQVPNPASVPRISLQHHRTRQVSLCIPMTFKRCAIFVSAYNPTLTSAEGVKNAFRDELAASILSSELTRYFCSATSMRGVELTTLSGVK